jgi:uncharacterized membrane protein
MSLNENGVVLSAMSRIVPRSVPSGEAGLSALGLISTAKQLNEDILID